jgi:hypothetical protein
MKNQQDMKLIDLAKNKEETMSSHSNDKSSNISAENKQKFNFIKKKGPQVTEDIEVEINSKQKVDNLFDNLNKSNVLNSAPSKIHTEPNLINMISNENTSNLTNQSQNPKFSFIKTKKNDTSSNSLVNLSNQGNVILNYQNGSSGSVNKGKIKF